MNKTLRQLAAAVATMLLVTYQAHADPSASAIALDDETIRINIVGISADSVCIPTRVKTYLDVAQQGWVQQGQTVLYPVGDSSIEVDVSVGGDYYFWVNFCIGRLDDTNPEPVMFQVDTNVVTISGPLPVPSPPAFVDVIPSGSPDTYTISWPASTYADEYQIANRVHPLDDWDPGFEPSWGGWSSYATNGELVYKTYSGQPDDVYQYRVIACNDTGCSDPTGSLPVVVEPQQANAGEMYYLPDAKVRSIWTAPEGCYVLFEALPEACSTQFSNAHALIPFQDPNHEKMYSQVFMAKAMGKRIDIWFDDNGDCESLAALMTIGKIEILDISSTRRTAKTDGGNGND